MPTATQITVTRPDLTGARRLALFCSGLQPSDAPTAGTVATAISRAVQQFGIGGCAGQMAQEFRDHPDVGARNCHRATRRTTACIPRNAQKLRGGSRLMNTISFHKLTKRYGSVLAVDDLSFDVLPGRVTGFLGPNGSGKTTTLRILLGLAAPTSGTATIAGWPYRRLPDPMRRVGAALDSNTFHPGRSAAQHLRIITTAADLPPRRVDEVLDLTGLSDVAGRKVGGFSLGMRQRLSLAGALLGHPCVLVLDEPLNGLDPDGIRWIRGLLRSLAARDRTVLVSSHLLSEVAQIVDDVVVVSRGRLVAQGPLSELTARTSVIRARTPDASRLREVLRAAGILVRLVDHSTVEARSATADAVGLAAAQAGLPIFELSRQDEDLESLFFDLVHQNQEIAA